MMIDPVALSLFGWDIHWYGLLWVIGFFVARFAAVRLGPQLLGETDFGPQRIADLCLYCLLGTFIGARLGYVLIYGFDKLIDNPLWLFAVNQGGMSFHGGFLGIVGVLLWQAQRSKLPVLRLSDVVSIGAPLGLACGRLGNFINGELWGRPTELPWGMVFTAADELPRHPSQLYELVGEGLLLFALLAVVTKLRPPVGLVSALFIGGYGVARFVVEFFREPDAHMGYYWLDLTAGQLLSLPMVIVGAVFAAWVLRRSRSSTSD